MSFMLLLVIAAFCVTFVVFVSGRCLRNWGRAKSLLDYWMGLLVLTVACFLPVFLLIWAVDSYVIRIPTAIDAVLRFDPHPAKFEDNIEKGKDGDLSKRHGEELRKGGASDDEIRSIQETLWANWPTIVGTGLLFLFMAIRALAHSHLALLREVEANDNCPPGGADSYVGVRTLDSPRRHQADVWFGEEREARCRASLRLGNRSSHEIHQRGGLYERIAVARDDFAQVILSSIAERGPARVIERLAKDLHEPGHHEIEESASGFPERDDEVYEKGGYVLIWNARRRYVSLACAVESDARVTS